MSKSGNRLDRVRVQLDRHQLCKRRWRTQAEDGLDLAVDLPEPCSNGDILYATEDKEYVADQTPENVLIVPLPRDNESACKLGWFLGNQHLPVDIREGCLLLEDKDLIRERLSSLGIKYSAQLSVFQPPAHSHVHHH